MADKPRKLSEIFTPQLPSNTWRKAETVLDQPLLMLEVRTELGNFGEYAILLVRDKAGDDFEVASGGSQVMSMVKAIMNLALEGNDPLPRLFKFMKVGRSILPVDTTFTTADINKLPTAPAPAPEDGSDIPF